MNTPEFLTTRQVGDLVDQPDWLVRRIVDALAPPVEKFGHKRMVPRVRLPEIRRAIEHHLERRKERKAAPL